MRGLRSTLLLILFASALSCFAANDSNESTSESSTDQLTFGPEFTFPSDSLKIEKKLKQRMYQHLVTGQTRGNKFTVNIEDGYFESPNGWWMRIMDDPGVIEVTMSPMTAGEFRKFGSDIQDALFVSAYNEGLFPSQFLGGGHINIGLSYFKDKPLLLRNFIVDFFNHNELSMGVFGYDTHNALPFVLYNDSTKTKVLKVIKKFDKVLSKFASYPEDTQESMIDEFLNDLLLINYQSTDRFMGFWRWQIEELYEDDRFEPPAREKNVALFSGKNGRERLEIRSVRPQPNIKTWIHQISLLEGRIKYLESITEPIAFEPKVPILAWAQTEIRKSALNPPLNPEKALRRFYEYVSESGQKWRNHRSYLWPAWIQSGELKKFENSDWFKSREAKRCASLL